MSVWTYLADLASMGPQGPTKWTATQSEAPPPMTAEEMAAWIASWFSVWEAYKSSPRDILPGESFINNDGEVMAVTAAGAVYRDGYRQGTATVTKMVLFGKKIFAVSTKPGNPLYEWVGVRFPGDSGWILVDLTKFDSTVLSGS